MSVTPVAEVLLPYRFTLLSNTYDALKSDMRFYYPIDLHYSQTRPSVGARPLPFYYPIDLHYSQTGIGSRRHVVGFITL